MKRPRDQAIGLLRKASHDLIAADATLATERALDVVCFHAQQAVEKSLKAVLALHDIGYPWRHDLGELLGLVRPILPQIAPYEDDILSLAPFAVGARYDAEFDPAVAEATEAFDLARRVFDLVAQTVDVDVEGWYFH